MGKQSREKWERRESVAGRQVMKAEEKYDFQTGLEKACLFIIRWGAVASLFVPLIILTQFFFPFVAPKSTIFRILVEIIFAAYLILVIHKSSYRPRISPLTIAITVFLVVFALASFAGVNFGRSFWSTYERMTGLFTMFHLYAFFIILVSCFKKREDWEKFLGVSALAGVFLSLYILKGNELSTRGGGTIGNTSFMAAYLLFDIFFAIILFSSNFLKRNGWPLFWQIFSGISLLIMLPVLFKSSARGAINFFEIGIFLLVVGWLLFSGVKNLKRIALAIILIAVVSGVMILISPPDLIKNKINGLLYEMQPRFTVWQIAFKAWQERPILGWGPENFNVPLTKYFNPCMFVSECGGEIWFDRAHNIVLDTLSTIGIVGFLSYLAVFIAALGSILRIMPKVIDKRNIFMPLGMAILLLVYFGQNFLVFDMINTYLVFFLSLAFISFMTQGESQIQTGGVKVKKISHFLVFAIAVPTIGLIWLGNIKPLIAGEYIVKMVAEQDMAKSTEYFQKSLNSWMNKYENREHFSQKLTRVVSQPIPASQKDNLIKVFNLTEGEMEKGIKENSLDFRPHLFLGKLYNADYQISKDPEDLKLALKYSEKSIELSPNNQQGYWYLGEAKLSSGKQDEAVALFKKALELEPRYLQAHWYLAMAYKIAGNYQLARDKILEAKELGYDWESNFSELKQAIDIFNYFKDDITLLPLYQKVVQLKPDDIQMWSGLIATYANLGQFNKARQVADQVKKMRPEAASGIDEFVKSFPK